MSAVVFALGFVSNPEMKRSEMAWIARHTTSETCSKKIISLEFFANFLFQDNCLAINEAKIDKQKRVKKLGGLGCNPKYKRRNLFQDNRAAINEAKNNKQQRVKKYRGSEASEGVQPQEKLKMFNHKRCYYK